MKRNNAVPLEEEKKGALLELGIALILLVIFIVFDIAVYSLYPLYQFVSAFYGPLVTVTLIHSALLLLAVLLWLVYRRWKRSDQITSELENVISSINLHVLLVLDPDQTIQKCSQSIEKVFGYKVEEVVNQKTHLLYDDQSLNFGHLSQTNEVLERRGFHVAEGICKRKDGKKFPVEMIIGKLANRPGSVVLLRDISERKNLEEELLRHQKLEALGRLAGGIAHDYNNFMTVISGFAKLMKRRILPSNPLRSDLEELLKTADKATTLTRQLLAFGRRQVVNPKIVNLNEIIEDMGKLLRQLLGENIELVMNLEKDLRPIKADVIQLEQLVLNLTLNARNAMPHGGKITIGTNNIGKIQLDYGSIPLAPESGDYIVLAVEDNGSGMSPEVKKHIFEPFFTTGEKRSGVGLGLATCYGIVQQNQGRIFVSSEPGQGTTIRVYFPCVEGSPEKTSEVKEPDVFPQGSETLLLAEDDPDVRAFASRVLREQGYEVLEAANGVEALDLAQHEAGKGIQLLLTDWIMPRMGGAELAEKLKNLRPEIKVLFTSGYVGKGIVPEGAFQGKEFLQKPFSPYSLATKVREVLER